MVEYKKVEPWMVQYVADNMRSADRIEVMASHGYTPIEALQEGVNVSDYCTAIFIDGDLIAILGLVVTSVISGQGVPWLLGTSGVIKHSREFLANSHDVVNSLVRKCPNMMNYVHDKNRVSIRWLKWLGFKMEPPYSFGVAGEKFRRFTMGDV